MQGVPVAESAFGRDPFDPVRHSRIADIIAEQADPRGIRVIDAESAADMLGRRPQAGPACPGRLRRTGRPFAGIARFPQKKRGESRLPDAEYAVVSGSIHPLALKQLEMARQAGFPIQVLDWSQKKGAWRFLSRRSSGTA